MDIGCALL